MRWKYYVYVYSISSSWRVLHHSLRIRISDLWYGLNFLCRIYEFKKIVYFNLFVSFISCNYIFVSRLPFFLSKKLRTLNFSLAPMRAQRELFVFVLECTRSVQSDQIFYLTAVDRPIITVIVGPPYGPDMQWLPTSVRCPSVVRPSIVRPVVISQK